MTFPRTESGENSSNSSIKSFPSSSFVESLNLPLPSGRKAWWKKRSRQGRFGPKQKKDNRRERKEARCHKQKDGRRIREKLEM